MELLQLTYFCDAAVTENFSRTAERFHVPPSNISQSIKRLERELGVPLFHRQANRVTLSPQGRAFFEKTRQAMELLQDARREAAAGETPAPLRLVIHVHRRIVMQAVERFRSSCPDVSIQTTHDLSAAQQADVVITAQPLELRGFTRKRLFREEIALAARQELLPAQEVTAQVLRQLPFITMGSGNSQHDITREIGSRMGFSPRIALQSEDPFYVRKCVELGLGVAFVPTLSWRDQFSQAVQLHRVGDCGREVWLYRRESRFASQLPEDFCRVLMEEIDRELAAERV